METCDHKWILIYRDGPTDTNFWKCYLCNESTETHGPAYDRKTGLPDPSTVGRKSK